MARSRLLVLVVSSLLALATALLPTTAYAASRAITDPAGDGAQGARLDITGATVTNAPRQLRVRIDYAQVARGDLVVFVQVRGQRGFTRVVSEYRPARAKPATTYLLDRDGKRSCRGLRATWDARADTTLVRVPPRCLRAGSYGAVRAKILTEIGADADLAPDTPRGGFPWGPWTPRG